MTELIRTDSANADFVVLVQNLDQELSVIDGSDHSFYSQFNKLDAIKHVVVAFKEGSPVACGAIKEYQPDTMEVKRMYTLPSERGKGLAGAVLAELENWAREMGYKKCVLETGQRLPDAIALYQKHGYSIIANYGQYTGVENSICFEKPL
jgi:putative acetyltransferase